MSDIQAQIAQTLDAIAAEHGVRILYASESGSRAWGFPSPDSDYDVRFIYAYPPHRYLSIEDPREELGPPPDAVLDLKGWDLRKTLKLLRTSNATPFEWLQSPTVYRQEGSFAERARGLMPDYFAPRRAAHHYLGLARKTWLGSLQEPEVKLKKYFYALRPLAAALWITERGGVPPMEFAPLRAMILGTDVNAALDRLLEAKEQASEGAVMPPDSVLHAYIHDTLPAAEAKAAEAATRHTDAAAADRLFRDLLHEF